MSNENAIANEVPKPGTKDALKAENEALRAELEALKAAQEAQESQDEEDFHAPVVPVEERVDIYVEKGYANDDPNLLIGINGVNYVLPRGKTSNVPKFVAEEYYRSRKAQQALDEQVDRMLEASK